MINIRERMLSYRLILRKKLNSYLGKIRKQKTK